MNFGGGIVAEAATAADPSSGGGNVEWHVRSPNPKNPVVVFDVSIGGVPADRIKMELFADIAPKTAENVRQFCTGEHRKAGKPHPFGDRLLANLDLDSLENPPQRILGGSSSTAHTYRLNSKGLVSEELIKDDTMLVVGLGLSLCDSHDNTILEINKALRNQKLAHPEAAELAAIIHGLKRALELGVESIQFFCDDSKILAYVTGKAAPKESIVAKLLEQVSLLQTRFTSCQALALSGDIISVIKLAKDAIASQTRWCEGDTEYESCPVCYAYVSPNDKFEVSGCFHRICVTCMRKPFSSEQLLRGNTAICPYPDCENDLVPEDCRGFADADAITLMIQRKKEKAIPVKDRVYCPNPSCSFLMSDLDLIRHVRNNPRQSEARKCMECGLSFCKKRPCSMALQEDLR
ncbi:unnamed protein product [Arabidopsis halleri]